jgi:transcriptional regulator with XRE-family HTH domain
MTELLTPDEITARAKKAGMRIREVCERAGINPTTFWRWRKGKTAPSLAVYQRLYDATQSDGPSDNAPGQ